jgi:apolipoprotein N-acyltransferase
MPFGPLRSPEALGLIRARIPSDVTLIAGALRADDVVVPGRDRPLAYNSLIALGSSTVQPIVYDKIHLVPFGEYLPFQATLESIGLEQLSRMRGGFAAGPKPRPVLTLPGLPAVGVLICYEAIFPAAVVQGGVRPGVLVNITNDGWFGNTTGPRQHFHQSRVRAVEEGLTLIRAANNGISGLVDPYGRIIARLELNERATVDVAVPRAGPAPVYARVGDGLFLAAVFACLVMIGWPIARVLREPAGR